ncbi:uncharacterized protein LOC144877753 [Branchiostoma floridae x Branchiostoma japonicum]
MCSCTTILTFCMALVSLTAALQACTSPDGPGVCSCSGTRINCDYKNLDSIPDNIPSSTTYLTLRHNKIGAIENTKLQHLPNLTRLYIDNNEITIILSQIFVGLQNLRELYLHNNSISVVEPGSFQHLVELTVLYLHYNRLTSLPSDAFVNLNKLRTLSISHNQISTLNNHTFAGLYQLSYLGTSHNEIRSLDDGIFVGLNQLSYLDISFNFIAVIPSSVASLKSLKCFNMSYNEVATIQPNMFSSRFFETLDLSHNNITWVRDWTFSNITFDIRFTLKLKGNHIKQLGKYSFYNISSKYDHMAYNHADIDLSDTQLERIHEEAFTYTLRNVHFGSFKFQDNNLETIPSTLCDFSTYPYDFRFNLSNNHWSCDCRMRKILNCPNLGDEISCRLPPVLNDIRLSDLTLSNLACSSPIIHNISLSVIGETLTVNCHATGLNRPTLTWSWTPVQPNGVSIARSHDEVSTTNLGYNSVESRLTINRTQISDQGHYTCHASNVVGDDRKTLSLFVIPAETEAVPSTTNIPSVCIPSHDTETVPSMTGPSTLSIPISATVTETVPSITESSTLPIPISATETVPSTTGPSTLSIPISATVTETVPSTTGPSTLSIPISATETVPSTTGPSTLSIPISATETALSATEPSTLSIPLSSTETVPSTTEPSTLPIPISATETVPSTTGPSTLSIPISATETVPSTTGPSTLSIPISATETVPSTTGPSTLSIPISATETVPSTTGPSALIIPSSATETALSTTGPSTLSIPSYATEAVPLTTGTGAGLSPSTNAVAPGHEENIAHSSATLIVATVVSFIGGVLLCIIVAMIVYIKRRANRSLANKSSPQDATVATAQRRRGVDNANLGFEDDDGEYEDVNLYELRASVYQNQTLQREGPGDQDDVGRDGRIYDQIPQQGLGTASDPGESENHLYQDLLEERDHIYTSLQREGQRSEPHRPVH